MIRVLLDSDLILDYVLMGEGHYEAAEDILDALVEMEFVGFVSAIALLNVHYFAQKEVDRAFAKNEVGNLLSLLSVCTIDEPCFHAALTLGFDDYEDAVQCASAIDEGLDGIVTLNKKDFEKSPIPVYSPLEFLGILQNK